MPPPVPNLYLSESDLEEIVDVWQRKSRRVNV